MGSFARAGTFKNRDKFLEGFRGKLAKLRGAALQGMTETWEKGDAGEIARLAGFGLKIEFKIGTGDWSCAAEIPDWIPIPQKSIEEKFDKEFSELSQL